MDYGVKISKAGIDVLSADPEELYFSSKYFNLKVKNSGEYSFISGQETTLSANIDNAVTTIPVNAPITDYPSTGVIWIGDGGFGHYEAIKYTGKTATSFTGCTRGHWGTSKDSWSSGDDVAPGYTKKTVYTHSLGYSPVVFCWETNALNDFTYQMPIFTATSAFYYIITTNTIEIALQVSAYISIPSGGHEFTINYSCMYDKIKA